MGDVLLVFGRQKVVFTTVCEDYISRILGEEYCIGYQRVLVIYFASGICWVVDVENDHVIRINVFASHNAFIGLNICLVFTPLL